jgi:hypothetical protein
MFISGAAVSAPSQVVPDEDATTLEMLGMSVVDQSPPVPYDATTPQLSEIHQCMADSNIGSWISSFGRSS